MEKKYKKSHILGVSLNHRTWCMICPMGTLQDKIGRIRKNHPAP